jgi:hypothetical protein
MTPTPLQEILRQAREAECDLEEVSEMVERDAGPAVADEIAAMVAAGHPDLALLVSGAVRALPWEHVRAALERLDPAGLAPSARALLATCYLEQGDDPPFTLTRADLRAGVGRRLAALSDDEIDEFLDDVDTTAEDFEELLGGHAGDADEWGRSLEGSTPLGAFRAILADELGALPFVARGAHLDTVVLLDDYLDAWTDCAGPEEITLDDLLGFAAWYLIAHTSASPGAITQHLGRVPAIVAVIDRHFDTHLEAAWSAVAVALLADIHRVLRIWELLTRPRLVSESDASEAEDGHWEFVDYVGAGCGLVRIEDGSLVRPVLFPDSVTELLRPGDILNLVLGPMAEGWVPLEAGPVYPARVAATFEEAVAAHTHR